MREVALFIVLIEIKPKTWQSEPSLAGKEKWHIKHKENVKSLQVPGQDYLKILSLTSQD